MVSQPRLDHMFVVVAKNGNAAVFSSAATICLHVFYSSAIETSFEKHGQTSAHIVLKYA